MHPARPHLDPGVRRDDKDLDWINTYEGLIGFPRLAVV